eukprot:6150726-Prymnesium_polylepis.1
MGGRLNIRTVASLQAVDAPGTSLSAGPWRTTRECCRRVRPVSAAPVANRRARHRRRLQTRSSTNVLLQLRSRRRAS